MQARDYAWGDWQEGYANTSEAGLSRTTAVGMYPHGQAECGAVDLAGNLWDWCLNDKNKVDQISISNNEYKLLRGGSFYTIRISLRRRAATTTTRTTVAAITVCGWWCPPLCVSDLW